MTESSNTDRWALYGGQDPREMPTYAAWEASRYLRVPLRTVQRWCFGYEGDAYRPLIQIADPERHLLSFWNIAELHVLDALRRFHQISPKKLRSLIDYTEQAFPTPHPLVNERMLTDGVYVFVERAGQLINATKAGQLAMQHLVEAHLQRIEQDVDGLAVRLFPFIRRKPLPEDAPDAVVADPRVISLDPRVRFGRPVIAGTSIPTLEIAERFRAGDSLTDLAGDYSRSVQEMEEAIRCELTLDIASAA